jgi:hypothetical protein
MPLHRYWIEFEGSVFSTGFGPGCGVTAWTKEDAIALLRSGPFRDKQMPAVSAIKTDVDVSSLDEGHVLPNMEAPNRRGIWYPRGFALP